MILSYAISQWAWMKLNVATAWKLSGIDEKIKQVWEKPRRVEHPYDMGILSCEGINH